jgi:PleD family two-component response regulator
MGVSTAQIVDAKVETVIARADAALYRAKALCRNRVCCDQAGMHSAPEAAART